MTDIEDTERKMKTQKLLLEKIGTCQQARESLNKMREEHLEKVGCVFQYDGKFSNFCVVKVTVMFSVAGKCCGDKLSMFSITKISDYYTLAVITGATTRRRAKCTYETTDGTETGTIETTENGAA